MELRPRNKSNTAAEHVTCFAFCERFSSACFKTAKRKRCKRSRRAKKNVKRLLPARATVAAAADRRSASSLTERAYVASRENHNNVVSVPHDPRRKYYCISSGGLKLRITKRKICDVKNDDEYSEKLASKSHESWSDMFDMKAAQSVCCYMIRYWTYV